MTEKGATEPRRRRTNHVFLNGIQSLECAGEGVGKAPKLLLCFAKTGVNTPGTMMPSFLHKNLGKSRKNPEEFLQNATPV
jgi:hypothetical protein